MAKLREASSNCRGQVPSGPLYKTRVAAHRHLREGQARGWGWGWRWRWDAKIEGEGRGVYFIKEDIKSACQK